MDKIFEIYRPSVYEDRLNQCEILSNISQFIPIIEEKAKAKELIQPFAIILTQDCDLNSDFSNRKNRFFKDVEDSPLFLPSVVLLPEFCVNRKNLLSDLV